MNADSPHTRPVRLRDRLRDETARAILGAAEEVLSEEGLGARMERIAERAGVAVGTLYNHFEDRQALLEALSCSTKQSFFARYDRAVTACEGLPVREQLRAVLGAVAEHGKAHGRYLAMLVQAGEGPAHPHPRNSFLTELVRRTDELVARAVAAGELREDAAGFFGLALIGLIRVANLRILSGGATWDELTEPLIDLFLRGAAR
jgi:AcrR family transcriptional regulator